MCKVHIEFYFKHNIGVFDLSKTMYAILVTKFVNLVKKKKKKKNGKKTPCLFLCKNVIYFLSYKLTNKNNDSNFQTGLVKILFFAYNYIIIYSKHL